MFHVKRPEIPEFSGVSGRPELDPVSRRGWRRRCGARRQPALPTTKPPSTTAPPGHGAARDVPRGTSPERALARPTNRAREAVRNLAELANHGEMGSATSPGSAGPNPSSSSPAGRPAGVTDSGGSLTTRTPPTATSPAPISAVTAGSAKLRAVTASKLLAEAVGPADGLAPLLDDLDPGIEAERSIASRRAAQRRWALSTRTPRAPPSARPAPVPGRRRRSRDRRSSPAGAPRAPRRPRRSPRRGGGAAPPGPARGSRPCARPRGRPAGPRRRRSRRIRLRTSLSRGR